MKPLLDWVKSFNPIAFRVGCTKAFEENPRRQPDRRKERWHEQTGAWWQAGISRFRSLPVLLLLTVPLPVYAQTTVEWDKTIGGTSWDNLTCLQQTRDGGYILGGTSSSDISRDKTGASNGEIDYWIVKLDSTGSKQWDKTLGGDKRDELTSLLQTSDGGYMVGGYSCSSTSGDKTQANRGVCSETSCTGDFWVVKLDGAGNKVWDKTFGGKGEDGLESLQQTRDGGYILGGWSQSDISGDKTEASQGLDDYWIVKLDAAGSKQWDKTIGGDKRDELTSLLQTSDGGYMAGGSSYSSISGDKTEANRGGNADYADYWIVKLDEAGSKQWDKTLGGSDYDFLSSLQQTSSGGYILGGTTISGSSGDKTQASRGGIDYWVVKLGADGHKQWDKTIGGVFFDYLSFLQQTLDGGYLLGGTSNSDISGDKTEAGQGQDDYWIVKLDAAGNKQWDKTIGGSGYDELSSLYQTRNGGIILGGWSLSSGSGDKAEASKGESDYWVVKLAPFPKGGHVKSFTLINTESEQPLRPLQDGDTINLAALPTQKLNLRANTLPDEVGSVRFELSGKQERTQTDHVAPYALFGDTRGDYEKWYPVPGSYTLRATPYSGRNAKGKAGTPLTIHFTVINKVPPPRLESFTLINTEREQPNRPLQDGDTINLPALPTQKLNIRANTLPDEVGSVRFELSGEQERTQTDHVAPYALFGDRRGDYEKWHPAPGSYTLRATAYSKPDGKGMASTPLTIHFTVINKVPPPLANPAIEWDKTIGGSDFDYLNSLQQASDGGYILGGRSGSAISGDKTEASKGSGDFWVVKLDDKGNKQWDKTIGGNQWDDLMALQQTPDKGYLLGGSSFSGSGGDKTQASRGDSDYWVVKLDANGSKQWDKTIGGNGGDELMTLQQTSDGGYLLGGTSHSGSYGDKTEDSRGGGDYWVVKLDANGNKQWDKTLGGTGLDRLRSLQQTSDGSYLLGGNSDSGISGDKTDASRGADDYWVVKLDATGNKIWDKTFGGDSWEAFASLQQTSDGGYLLGGTSYSILSGDKTEDNRGRGDYWLVKLDAAGNKQWDKTFGGSEWDELYTLQQAKDGGYILGGRSESAISGDKSEAFKGLGDFWLVKLDAAGNKQWDKTIGGDGQDVLQSLEPTSDGGIILGGWSLSSGSGDKTEASKGESDYWVVKLAPFPKGGHVESFTLINTESEQPLRPLQDGDTINLAALPTQKLNIRANTLPDEVGSVRFELSGEQERTQTDHVAPYALFGDRRGDYEKWYPVPGGYTLRATPYSGRDAKGQAGTPLTIHFTLVRKQAATVAARMEQAPQAARAALAPRLTLYPNPTPDGRLQVQLTGQGQGPLSYSLYSAVGRKLAEGTIRLTPGGNLLELDFSRQFRSTGLYYLRLEGGTFKQVLKIMHR